MDVFQQIELEKRRKEEKEKKALQQKDLEIQRKNKRIVNAREAIAKKDSLKAQRNLEQEMSGDVFTQIQSFEDREAYKQNEALLNEERKQFTDMATEIALTNPGELDLLEIEALTGIPITPGSMADARSRVADKKGKLTITTQGEDGQPTQESYDNAYLTHLNSSMITNNDFDAQDRINIFANIQMEGNLYEAIGTGYDANGEVITDETVKDYADLISTEDDEKDYKFKYTDIGTGQEIESYYLEVMNKYPQLFQLPFTKYFKKTADDENPYKGIDIDSMFNQYDADGNLIKDMSEIHNYLTHKIGDPGALEAWVEDHPFMPGETYREYATRMSQLPSSNRSTIIENPYYGWHPEDILGDFYNYKTWGVARPSSSELTPEELLAEQKADWEERTGKVKTRIERGDNPFPFTDANIFENIYGNISMREWSEMLEDNDIRYSAFNPYKKQDEQYGKGGYYGTDTYYFVNEGTIADTNEYITVSDYLKKHPDTKREDIDLMNPPAPWDRTISFPFLDMTEELQMHHITRAGTWDDRFVNAVLELSSYTAEWGSNMVGLMDSWSDYTTQLLGYKIEDGTLDNWKKQLYIVHMNQMFANGKDVFTWGKDGPQVKDGLDISDYSSAWGNPNTYHNRHHGSIFDTLREHTPGLIADLMTLKGANKIIGAATLPTFFASQYGAQTIEDGREEILNDKGEVVGQQITSSGKDVFWSTVKGAGEGYLYHLAFRGTSAMKGRLTRTAAGGTIMGGPQMIKDIMTEGKITEDTITQFVMGAALTAGSQYDPKLRRALSNRKKLTNYMLDAYANPQSIAGRMMKNALNKANVKAGEMLFKPYRPTETDIRWLKKQIKLLDPNFKLKGEMADPRFKQFYIENQQAIKDILHRRSGDIPFTLLQKMSHIMFGSNPLFSKGGRYFNEGGYLKGSFNRRLGWENAMNEVYLLPQYARGKFPVPLSNAEKTSANTIAYGRKVRHSKFGDIVIRTTTDGKNFFESGGKVYEITKKGAVQEYKKESSGISYYEQYAVPTEGAAVAMSTGNQVASNFGSPRLKSLVTEADFMTWMDNLSYENTLNMIRGESGLEKFLKKHSMNIDQNVSNLEMHSPTLIDKIIVRKMQDRNIPQDGSVEKAVKKDAEIVNGINKTKATLNEIKTQNTTYWKEQGKVPESKGVTVGEAIKTTKRKQDLKVSEKGGEKFEWKEDIPTLSELNDAAREIGFKDVRHLARESEGNKSFDSDVTPASKIKRVAKARSPRALAILEGLDKVMNKPSKWQEKLDEIVEAVPEGELAKSRHKKTTESSLVEKPYSEITDISKSIASLQKTQSTQTHSKVLDEINEMKSDLKAGYVYKDGKMVKATKGEAVQLRRRLMELEGAANKAMQPKEPQVDVKSIDIVNDISNVDFFPARIKAMMPSSARNVMQKKLNNIKSSKELEEFYENTLEDIEFARGFRDSAKTKAKKEMYEKAISVGESNRGKLEKLLTKHSPDYLRDKQNKAEKIRKEKIEQRKQKYKVEKPSAPKERKVISYEKAKLLADKHPEFVEKQLDEVYGVDSIDQLSKQQLQALQTDLEVRDLGNGIEMGFMGMTPQNMKLLHKSIIDAGKFTYNNLPKSMQKQADKLGITYENFKQKFKEFTNNPKGAAQNTKAFFKKVWQHLKKWYTKGKQFVKDYLNNPKVGMSIQEVDAKGRPLSAKERMKIYENKVKSKAPNKKQRTKEGMLERIPPKARAKDISTPTTTEAGKSFTEEASTSKPRRRTIPQEELTNMLSEALVESNAQNVPKNIKPYSPKDIEAITGGALKNRYWYEISAEAFQDKVRIAGKDNMTKFHHLLSATSAVAEPYVNMTRALSVLAEHMQGEPISTSLINKTNVTQALRGESHLSPKIGNFGQTFDYVSGLTKQPPLTTNDRQVAAEHGITPTNIGSNASLYEAISNYKIKVTDRLNEGLVAGEQPWTPWQLQAGGWVNVRKQKGVSQTSDDYNQVLDNVFKFLENRGIKLPIDAKTGQRYIDESILRNKKLQQVLQPSGQIFKNALKGNLEFASTGTIEGSIASENLSIISSSVGSTSTSPKDNRVLTRMQKAYIDTYKRAINNLVLQPDYKPSVLNRMIDSIIGKRFKLSRVTQETGGWENAVNLNATFPLAESQSTGLTLNGIETNGLLSILGKYGLQDAVGSSLFKRLDSGVGADTYQLFVEDLNVPIHTEQYLLKAIKTNTGQSLGFNKIQHPNGTLYQIHPQDGVPSRTGLEKAFNTIFDGEVTTLPSSYNSRLVEKANYNDNIRSMKNGIAEKLAIPIRDSISKSGTRPPTVGQIITAIKGRKPIGNYIKGLTKLNQGKIEKARIRYQSRDDSLTNAIKDYKQIVKSMNKELSIVNKGFEKPLANIAKRSTNTYEEILGDGIQMGFMGFTPQNMKLIKKGLVDTGTFLYKDLPKHLQQLGKSLHINSSNFVNRLNSFSTKWGRYDNFKQAFKKMGQNAFKFWKSVWRNMKKWWAENKHRLEEGFIRVSYKKRKGVERDLQNRRVTPISQAELVKRVNKQLAIAKMIENNLIKSGAATKGDLVNIKKQVLGTGSIGDLTKKGKPVDQQADYKIREYNKYLRRFMNRKRAFDVTELVKPSEQYPTPVESSPKEVMADSMGDVINRRTVRDSRLYDIKDPGLKADFDKRKSTKVVFIGKDGTTRGAVASYLRSWHDAETFLDKIQQKAGVPIYEAWEDVRSGYGNLEAYSNKWLGGLQELMFNEFGTIDFNIIPLTNRARIHKAGQGDAEAYNLLTASEIKVLEYMQSYYKDPNVQKMYKINRVMNWLGKEKLSNSGIKGVDVKDLLELKEVLELQGPNAFLEAIDKVDGLIIDADYMPNLIDVNNYQNDSYLNPDRGFGKGVLNIQKQTDANIDALTAFRRKVRADGKLFYLEEPIQRVVGIAEAGLPAEVRSEVGNMIENLNQRYGKDHDARLIQFLSKQVIKNALFDPIKWIRQTAQPLLELPYEMYRNMPKMLFQMTKHRFLTDRLGGLPVPGRGILDPTKSASFLEAPIWQQNYFTRIVAANSALENEFINSVHMPWLEAILPKSVFKGVQELMKTYGYLDAANRWVIFKPIVDRLMKELDLASRTGKDFNWLAPRIYWTKIGDFRSLQEMLGAEIDQALRGNLQAQQNLALRIAEHITSPATNFRYLHLDRTIGEQSGLGKFMRKVSTFPLKQISNFTKDTKGLLIALKQGDYKSAHNRFKYIVGRLMIMSKLLSPFLNWAGGDRSEEDYGWGYTARDLFGFELGGLLTKAAGYTSETHGIVFLEVGEAIKWYNKGHKHRALESLNNAAEDLLKLGDTVSLELVSYYRQTLWGLEVLFSKEEIRPFEDAVKIIQGQYDQRDVERSHMELLQHLFSGYNSPYIEEKYQYFERMKDVEGVPTTTW